MNTTKIVMSSVVVVTYENENQGVRVVYEIVDSLEELQDELARFREPLGKQANPEC